MIQKAQYGSEFADVLPPAAYKLAENLENGRGVYTFCMCPGGYVVNASSEQNRLAVNGMSYHDRSGANANSAVIVTVTPEDFGSDEPLAGVEFQRRLEKAAFVNGDGCVPVQCFGDFCKNEKTEQLGTIVPQIKGQWKACKCTQHFPRRACTLFRTGNSADGSENPRFCKSRRDTFRCGKPDFFTDPHNKK